MNLCLPNYTLVEKLYEGKHSFVYRAIRNADQRRTVIKLLKDDRPNFHLKDQLHHEFVIMNKLHSPHVVQTYGLEEVQGSLFLIMEDFDGIPLRNLIKAKHLDLMAFLRIAIALCDGLAEIHHAHIIHKDIKPQNIIINFPKGQIKYIDFGIATVLSREIQQIANPNIFEGTLAYVSPEQTGRMNRAIDYRTDIYSLGITLYEMATYQLPFLANDFMEMVHLLITQVPSSPHEVNPKIPLVISEIILRCIEKSPENRYHSVLGVKNDFLACLQQLEEKGNITYFEPGQLDLYDHFQIPQKLYGRENEIEKLLSVFEACSHGSVEILLLTGYAGIGKSRLINEIQKPVVQKRGFFISGKFDQFKKNIPYSALTQAFQSLVQQLLAENDQVLDKWRHKLAATLNGNGQLLVDIIPQLELITGPQKSVAIVDPQQSENRLRFLFAAFIDVFLQKEHPLVIFLDDLQWADDSSLKLLHSLASDPARKYLFIIGAYRDTEVDATHPLSRMIEEMRKTTGNIKSIVLKPLLKDSIIALIKDAFHSSQAHIEAVANIVYQKTQGNPFFVVEFLKMLYDKSLLDFDPVNQRWTANISEIIKLQVTDNVADLLSQKIRALLPSTQELLQIGAAIGNTFDLQTLSLVKDRSLQQTKAAIEQALEEELIFQYRTAYDRGQQPYQEDKELQFCYSFQHDRIQQAVYELTSEDEKIALHWKIGNVWLENLPEEKRQEKIIDIAHHLNYGEKFVTDLKVRENNAQVNWQAGEKAKNATAFSSALEYFSHGIKWLGTDCWKQYYDLSLPLFENVARCAFFLGDHKKVEDTIDLILKHGQTVQDKVEPFHLKIRLYIQMSRFKEAFLCGKEALELLKSPFVYPVKKSSLYYKIAVVQFKMWWLGLKRLTHLPELKDQRTFESQKILNSMVPAAIRVEPDTFVMLVFSIIQLSLKYGMSEYAKHAIGVLAILFNSEKIHRYQYGCKLGSVAMQMAEATPNLPRSIHTAFVYYLDVKHWKEPISTCIEPLKQVEKKCFEFGNILLASSCLLAELVRMYVIGKSLNYLRVEINKSILQMKKYNTVMEKEMVIALRYVCAGLRSIGPEKGNRHLQSFDPSIRDIPYFIIIHSIFQMTLHYYYGQHDQVIKIADDLDKYKDHIPGELLWLTYYFHLAMALAAKCENKDMKKTHWKKLMSLQQRVKRWSEACPINFSHKFLLLSAEIKRVSGDTKQALELYKQAIEAAAKNQYPQEEALAYELQAKCYLDQSMEPQAAFYMIEACYAYSRWGAKGKVKQLKQDFEELLSKPLEFGEESDKASAAPRDLRGTTWDLAWRTATQGAAYNTARGSRDEFDTSLLLQASKALAYERVFDKLVAKIMHIVMENGAADYTCLILPHRNQLMIFAEAKGVLYQPINPIDIAEKSNDLCLTVVKEVQKKNKQLVLNNPRGEGAFIDDAYIVKNHPEAILCVPFIYQGQLAGILYLENNLSKNGFSPETVRIFSLLAPQMAIYLQNALLYASLEKKVDERSTALTEKKQDLEQALNQLQTMQNQLIQQGKMASLGLVTSGMAHEIKNPLNFIINFAELSKLTLEDIEKFATVSHSYVKQDILQGFTTSFNKLKTNIGGMIQQGLLADSLVKKVEEHASKQTGLIESTPLNPFLDESIDLFYAKFQAKNPHTELIIVKNYDNSIQNAAISPHDMTSVIHNLLENALYAIDQKKQKLGIAFHPTITIQTLNQKTHLTICIRDNGSGIPESMKPHIFTPFFTTKPAGTASGLGLSFCYNIVHQQHGGTLTFTSQEGEYTEFMITLPAIQTS